MNKKMKLGVDVSGAGAYGTHHLNEKGCASDRWNESLMLHKKVL
jgi:hypothetical protein